MISRAFLPSWVLSPANMRGLVVACLCFVATIVHAEASESSEFAPTIANKTPAPGPAPEGMVWIPGGEFSMGASTNGHGTDEMPMASNDSGPVHRVRVDGFWMDTTPVTNEHFEKFVKATGYVTIAERTPTKEEFPTAPAENLVAGSVVFAPPDHEVALNDHYQWWTYVKGANWRHPLGPQSDIKGKEKYPVVQIAYPDAEAWPTKAESLAIRKAPIHRLIPLSLTRRSAFIAAGHFFVTNSTVHVTSWAPVARAKSTPAPTT